MSQLKFEINILLKELVSIIKEYILTIDNYVLFRNIDKDQQDFLIQNTYRYLYTNGRLCDTKTDYIVPPPVQDQERFKQQGNISMWFSRRNNRMELDLVIIDDIIKYQWNLCIHKHRLELSYTSNNWVYNSVQFKSFDLVDALLRGELIEIHILKSSSGIRFFLSSDCLVDMKNTGSGHLVIANGIFILISPQYGVYKVKPGMQFI